MFRNPKKIKKFPQGTFISTPARILSILQLCIAFTMLFWILGKPFLEDSFILKKYSILSDALKENQEYVRLPQLKKEALESDLKKVKDMTKNSFLADIKKVFYQLAWLSPYKILWILFAIMVSIFLLKKNPHSKVLIWILPFLASVYLMDNLLFATHRSLTYEEQLFPTEAHLVDNYLKHSLSKSLILQKEELEKGFTLYLQDKWQENSYHVSSNYAFNLARLDAYKKDIMENKHNKYLKEPFIFLLSYLIWNFFYSAMCYKHIKILY